MAFSSWVMMRFRAKPGVVHLLSLAAKSIVTETHPTFRFPLIRCTALHTYSYSGSKSKTKRTPLREQFKGSSNNFSYT